MWGDDFFVVAVFHIVFVTTCCILRSSITETVVWRFVICCVGNVGGDGRVTGGLKSPRLVR